ncbi:hypothetical protein [Devosia sp. 2618]|uniref:hypothetical protein n=1 Tax=Devosia sp. 2618 TaxID=3156454 RepID=UPI003390B4A4
MTNRARFSLRLFVLFTAVPALLIGGGLWYLGSLIPPCVTEQHSRLTSLDDKFDLVVFSRDCGATTGANTQAALVPARDELPDDATSFFSVGVAADLDPRWDGFGNIELQAPAEGTVYRKDDSVAGINVIYH